MVVGLGGCRFLHALPLAVPSWHTRHTLLYALPLVVVSVLHALLLQVHCACSPPGCSLVAYPDVACILRLFCILQLVSASHVVASALGPLCLWLGLASASILSRTNCCFFWEKLFLLCAVPKHRLMLRLVGAVFAYPSMRDLMCPLMTECHLHLIGCWHVLCSLMYEIGACMYSGVCD